MTHTMRFRPPEPPYVTPVLDASQLRVIGANPSSSFVVLGAPGSGKTITLIESVASRIESGSLAPSEILVLTPQRLAANRLREALAARVRRATPGSLARTPMSFALECATQAAFRRRDVPPRLLTGAEQDRIIAQLLAGEVDEGSSVPWPPSLSVAVRQTRVFRSEMRDLIDRCVDLGIDPDELERLGTVHDIPEWVSVANFWSDHLAPVVDTFRFGFADAAEITRQASIAISSSSAGESIRAVFVDDAQELTHGTVAMLASFAGRGVPVALFGNPDEAATTFRGAMPQILGQCERYLGVPATSFTLEQVYRHDDHIRRVVTEIESRIGTATAGTQRSAGSAASAPASRISVVVESQRATEVAQVAKLLRGAHVREGIPWSRMAVVVRQGSLVDNIARLLSANEVPTRSLVSEQALRDQPLVRELVGLIRLAADSEELSAARAENLLLSDIGGMTSLEVRRLRLALRHLELAAEGSRTGPELVRDALANPHVLELIGSAPARAAHRLALLLADVRSQLRGGGTIEEILWTIWQASPMSRTLSLTSPDSGLVADQTNRRLDTILALFTAARRFVEREPHRTATDFIADLMHSDVPEDTLAPSSDLEAVLVCTPSALIGDERDVVAVMAVQEGVWPNLRPRGQLLQTENVSLIHEGGEPVRPGERTSIETRLTVAHDELRMFALACSRARRHLIVSAMSSDDTMPSPFLTLVSAVSRPPEFSADATPPPQEATDDPFDYPLTLTGMTGWLRRRLAALYDVAEDSAVPREPEVAAGVATLLAHLAEAGVPGAPPAHWYGVPPPSTELPLVTSDERAQGQLVSISPSRLEAWNENPFGWFLDTTMGGDQTIATGVGTLLHKAFERAGSDDLPDLHPDTLWSVVDARWHELSFESEWLGERERRRAEVMVRNLAGYLTELRSRGIEIIGVECRFDIVVGGARLRGRIDQLHRHPDGTVSIADLKTGRVAKSAQETADNAQLYCYQLALVRDAIVADPSSEGSSPSVIVAEGAESGGATLVYVDAKLVPDSQSFVIRTQPPMTRGGATQEEVERHIVEAAAGMAGDTFEAVVFTREERNEFGSRYLRRIHTVKAVSSS